MGGGIACKQFPLGNCLLMVSNINISPLDIICSLHSAYSVNVCGEKANGHTLSCSVVV